jgi:hypothetical protein
MISPITDFVEAETLIQIRPLLFLALALLNPYDPATRSHRRLDRALAISRVVALIPVPQFPEGSWTR